MAYVTVTHYPCPACPTGPGQRPITHHLVPHKRGQMCQTCGGLEKDLRAEIERLDLQPTETDDRR